MTLSIPSEFTVESVQPRFPSAEMLRLRGSGFSSFVPLRVRGTGKLVMTLCYTVKKTQYKSINKSENLLFQFQNKYNQETTCSFIIILNHFLNNTVSQVTSCHFACTITLQYILVLQRKAFAFELFFC